MLTHMARKPTKPRAAAVAAAPAPAIETATVWFHPQRGAQLSTRPFSSEARRYRGGNGADWREVCKVQVIVEPGGSLKVLSRQKLPKGFEWGDASKQVYGMGGPALVFGPLEKVCRDCKQPFVFSAAAQKELLEEQGAYIDTTAVRCLRCGQARSKLEAARLAHARALNALAPDAPAQSFLAAARAALALLTTGGIAIGDRVLDRALGHCRKAKSKGAGAAETVEQKLVELRQTRAQGAQPAPRRKA